MAAFPLMSSLATVHLYGDFRADERTEAAACAFSVIAGSNWKVTSSINFFLRSNLGFRAKCNAKLASFA